MFDFIKKKIIYLISCMALSFLIFYTFGDSFAKDNAYLACFIDDSSFMFRSEVLYSGNDIEASRIAPVLASSTAFTGFSSPADLYNNYGTENFFPLYVSNDNGSRVEIRSKMFVGAVALTDKNVRSYCFFPSNSSYASNGIGSSVNYYIDGDDITKTILPKDIKWVADNNMTALQTALNKMNFIETPLTFPATHLTDDDVQISTSDINRAYQVQSAICEDFKDALLFLNDGNSFVSVQELSEMAFYLVTADDGATITNKWGSKYTVDILDNNGKPIKKDSSGYKHYLRIIDSKGNRSREFCWKVKKGYVGCDYGEKMENGARNNLNVQPIPAGGDENAAWDTVYITWEHLFLEAEVLYAQGISYASQADIYNMDDLESSITKNVRKLLSGLESKLQLYTIEDCIFNNGIRGTAAFVNGIYSSSKTSNIVMVYLIFIAITLSLVVMTLVSMIIKKQYSTVSPTARVSLLDSIKDLLIALVIIGVSFPIFKLVITLNFKFVQIWATFVGDNTLSDRGAGLSTLASIIYEFAFLIITIYINFVYIIRQISVPILIATSPLFIYGFSLGTGGKKMANAWLKELLGNIFIQSFHAFVYGFIIMSSAGLRGIERIVICYSIIPLTALIKDIVGIGGDKLLKQAASATNTTAMIGGAVGSTTGQVIGSAVSSVGSTAGAAIGAVAGGPVGAAAGAVVGKVGNIVGEGIKAAGGAQAAFTGAGLMVALGEDGRMGSTMVNSGSSTIAKSGSAMVTPPRRMGGGSGGSPEPSGGTSGSSASGSGGGGTYASSPSSGGGYGSPSPNFGNQNFGNNSGVNEQASTNKYIPRFPQLNNDYKNMTNDMRATGFNRDNHTNTFEVTENGRNADELKTFNYSYNFHSNDIPRTDAEKAQFLERYNFSSYKVDEATNTHKFESPALNVSKAQTYETDGQQSVSYRFRNDEDAHNFFKNYEKKPDGEMRNPKEKREFLSSYGFDSMRTYNDKNNEKKIELVKNIRQIANRTNENTGNDINKQS